MLLNDLKKYCEDNGFKIFFVNSCDQQQGFANISFVTRYDNIIVVPDLESLCLMKGNDDDYLEVSNVRAVDVVSQLDNVYACINVTHDSGCIEIMCKCKGGFNHERVKM